MLEDLLENWPTSSVFPIVDRGLGNSSYVVDLGDGSALIVDPERDPRPYLQETTKLGLTPRLVIETHLHADFVSGAHELMAEGAELWAPGGSELTFPHVPLHDEEEKNLGGLTLRVIATPGHTPEHLSYLLVDDSRPVALFSGGTLMAGGAARTDLISPSQTEPLARSAYHSIVNRLFKLPDDLGVYPTHGGGSFCSVGSGGKNVTTIGQEKTANPLLAVAADEDTFVRRLLSGYGTYPPYFRELRGINRQLIETFGSTPPLLPRISIADFERAMAAGSVVVDVRGIRRFARGHVPGAISNTWRDQFATWLGWIVPRTSPVLFVASEDIDPVDLAWAALTVGFENLVGVLDGGMDAWTAAGNAVASIAIADSDVGERQIVDVRQVSEYEMGHVEGAINVELGALVDSTDGIPGESLLVHCGHGERAMTAASLLSRAGYGDVTVFEGGPPKLGRLIADDQ